MVASDQAYGRLPRQKLDVYRSEKRNKSAPIVVIFYGGSWNSGRKEDYAFLAKAIASRGFIAIVVDYRLVPSVRFPSFLEDSALAVVWAHQNAVKFGGDPAKLFLLGHSAGAYNAVMVALDERYLRSLGSSSAIIRGVAALSGPYDFLPFDVDSTKEAFGKAENAADTQPINFASNQSPAMFLATGTDDTTVLPSNTLTLGNRLQREGADVTIRRYPGLGHADIVLALSIPFRQKASVLDDITEFIASRN